MKYLVILFLLINVNIFYCQNNIGNGKFRNLQDAIRANPDSVIELDLSSQDLKKFPKAILTFKNLEVLIFGADYISMHLTEIDEARRNKYIKDSLSGFVIYFPDLYKPNNIKRFPKKIAQLNKLKFLDLTNTKISRRRAFWLQKHMPKCEVLHDFMKD